MEVGGHSYQENYIFQAPSVQVCLTTFVEERFYREKLVKFPHEELPRPIPLDSKLTRTQRGSQALRGTRGPESGFLHPLGCVMLLPAEPEARHLLFGAGWGGP